MNKKILVVEDDSQIRNYICYSLDLQGYECITGQRAQDALSILVSRQIDLMILDLGLPDFDGMKVIQKVREWSEMPIIVVSARDQDKEKIAALDEGADDYLTKPFSANELMARVRVALRRFSKYNDDQVQVTYQIRDLKIDLERHLVYLNDTEIHLTPMQYDLLVLFFKNAGKVLTTQHIIRELWSAGYGNDTQALRALMAGLRRKIEKTPAKPCYIKTEIGVGYRLMDE